MHTLGEVESGIIGESSINLYKLSRVEQITGEKLLYNTGSPVWQSVMTGRDGKVGGEGDQTGRGVYV